MSGVKTDPGGAEDIAHHSLAFNPVEFDGIRKQAGLNSFTLTPKQWIERTGAIQQMKLLTADDRTPKLPKGKKGKSKPWQIESAEVLGNIKALL